MFMNFIIYLALILTGLCLGSFAAATVWRLRAKQLDQDKKDGEPINKKEDEKLNKIRHKSPLKDHSCCLNCGYRLQWFDMIPLISWIYLRGRCRKCHKKIGSMEILAEIGLATFFVVSYLFWPYGFGDTFLVIRFILWLIAGVILTILFFYDKKWFLLPDSINVLLVVVGLANFFTLFINSYDKLNLAINTLASIGILSGLYLLLYLVSKGRWIGFGDIKLGLGLALFLPDWKLAFLALFAANLVGCLVVLPGLITRKLKRTSHVPFGPFLIIGMFIASIFGNQIINWFFSSLV